MEGPLHGMAPGCIHSVLDPASGRSGREGFHPEIKKGPDLESPGLECGLEKRQLYAYRQFVIDVEHPGNASGKHAGDVPVGFGQNRPDQGHVPIVDQDVDRPAGPERITVEVRVVVDGPENRRPD